MSNETTILHGYSNQEKGAYLGAIASLATADRSATDEELDYIEALIESAEINDDQAQLIRSAATSEIADDDLKRFLDILKSSELRFSLVSDVIAFSQADDHYSEEEQHKVREIAEYLGLNQEQVSLLDQFTKKAVSEVPQQAEALQNDETTPKSFFDSLGFGDKLKNAGINTNSLFKGALGIIGPILLARMLGGKSRSGSGGGLLGGLLGAAGGGLLGGSRGGGGLLGGLGGLMSGGGLLGGLLGGGKGFGGAGGMLGRILGRR